MAAQLHKKAKDREIAPHLHSVDSEITHFLCVCAFLSEFTIDWLTTDLLLFPSKLPSLLIHLVLLPIWETLSRLWKFWKEKGCNPPGKKKRKRGREGGGCQLLLHPIKVYSKWRPALSNSASAPREPENRADFKATEWWSFTAVGPSHGIMAKSKDMVETIWCHLDV